jgi:hypothetical protein
MKTYLLKILTILCLVTAGCSENKNINEQIEDLNKTPDYEIDLSLGKGEFIGRLVDVKFGAWTTLVFQAGNGQLHELAYCQDKPYTDLNGEKVDIEFTFSKLIDSIIESMTAKNEGKFKNKSFKIKWQKFVFGDGLSPSKTDAVIIDFSIPISNPSDINSSKGEDVYGVYDFYCPDRDYYPGYYIHLLPGNKFKAKWEECEVGGITEGSFDLKTKFLILVRDASKDTFKFIDKKIIPYKRNPFLNCVFCDGGFYINSNKENKSLNSTEQNNSSSTEEQSSTSNINLSEIRGEIIHGGPRTVENLLGIPKERIIGPDYAEKVLHYKLGMSHEMRMLDYYVWVYTSTNAEENNNKNRKSLKQISDEMHSSEKYNLSGEELIIVFDKNDKVCKVAFTRDIKEPYDLTQ